MLDNRRYPAPTPDAATLVARRGELPPDKRDGVRLRPGSRPELGPQAAVVPDVIAHVIEEVLFRAGIPERSKERTVEVEDV